jgi:predicted ABC-type transport system involved in lysophospholipase L1 biosynthesis ATPase subunit
MAKDALVRLDHVARAFDNGAVAALQDVSLSVFQGDSIGIVGPSGSGKSTLIHLMCGMDIPTAGTVTWQGRSGIGRTGWTRLRASQIGVVFQDFLLLPSLTALQNVEMAVATKSSDVPLRTRALAALEQVGLSHRAHHLPHALSGGERQRVAIARGLINRPKLMLVDEPTGSLDSRNAAVVSELLFELQVQQGHALVLVTHDPALATRCMRCVTIRDGYLVQAAP